MSVSTVAVLFVLKPWDEQIIDNPPIINNPTNAYAYADTDIEVNVVVSDDKGVDTVILSYTTDLLIWNNITMEGTGTTTWLGASDIPGQDIEMYIYYKIYANDTINQWSINNNNSNYYEMYTGTRKALILCSTNDFYGDEFEETFNAGPDGTFDSYTENWKIQQLGYTFDNFPGAFCFDKVGGAGYGHANLTYDWLGNSYSLDQYAEYNMTVEIATFLDIIGNGVRIGLQWFNSTDNLVRTDWSEGITTATPTLKELSITGICNNDTQNQITNLKLIIDIDGSTEANNIIVLYGVQISKRFVVNINIPFDPSNPPPPPFIDSDGFPAQALQEYWILKDKGYTDENIFLMLYHTNDVVIDIYANDGIANDLLEAVIDVENNAVNASRFKQELDISKENSFASTIEPHDQLIISIIDHGSNVLLGDGNVTFHFEADNSNITEFEFYDLVKEIDCSRMLICVDCCFSGNFIQSNPGVFYDIPNAILISASTNVFSWYWINNNNGDGFAGSWFFNQFWDHLSQDTCILDAFIVAFHFTPFGRVTPLGIIQMPIIFDPNNLASIWSFSSIPKL
ncbi:MAG TPA: C13 family peptidase [Candidatus Bathyarchaeia archaeon]|nr:C13 family peptidase [Candidatus Bathyarchaeia archaeon]